MQSRFESISTTKLLQLLDDPKVKIIDTRPVDAYNGWKQDGENRGGHIQGAKSLPHKWISYMDWIEIVRSKGILPENELIIYGNEKESLEVLQTFLKAGYKDLKWYKAFSSDWTGNFSLPMENLERYEHLVSAEWLKNKLQEQDENNLIVCHAHYRNPADYELDHIPGAISIDTNELESPETWNRRSPLEIQNALCSKGINANSTVVLYGRFSFPDNDDPFPGSSAGHLGAIRAAFIMLYAGVGDVKILNGGMQSWKDAGFEVSSDTVIPAPVSTFGKAIPARPELAVDIPEAKEILASGDAELVSVRSWPEWIGEVSGYNYIEKKGRIPGAVFGNCGTDAYHMENYRNVDHTTREYHEVEKIWNEVGITKNKHLAFYCGTGWRGSEAFFNAWLMGWPRVSVFDGGWFEWSNDPQNPVEVGVPDKQTAPVP